MLKIALIVLVLISAPLAWAQRYEKIYSCGDRALFKVGGMEVRTPDGQNERVRDLCVAAYMSPKASLKFAMAPAPVTSRRTLFRDYIWVEIFSEELNYGRRTASVELSVEISSYTERNACYNDSAITFGVLKFKKFFDSVLIFTEVRDKIDVIGSDGSLIDRFAANGFSEMRGKLFYVPV